MIFDLRFSCNDINFFNGLRSIFCAMPLFYVKNVYSSVNENGPDRRIDLAHNIRFELISLHYTRQHTTLTFNPRP